MNRRLPTLMLVALLAALPATLARAAEVHQVVPAGDTVAGTLDTPGDVQRIPFRAVEGTLLGFKVKAGKGSALRPELRLLRTDRRPDETATALLKTSRKGNVVRLKKHALPDTGLRWLEIRGADGTTGDWSIRFKVKPPKKVVRDAALAATGTVDLPFVAPGNATGRLKVAAARRSATVPAFVELLGPDGEPVLVDEVREQKRGFQIRNAFLAAGGRYVLRVRDTAGAAGDIVLKAKFKVAKPFKRTLDIDDVITDPIVTDLTPREGDTSEIHSAVVAVEFARPGAVVVFREGASVVTIPATQIAVDDATAAFTLNLAPFQAGTYDVEVVNPDGGTGAIEDALEVRNAAAIPTSITPTSGRDDAVVRITVTGERFMSAATLRLLRDDESIDGTDVAGAGGLISADFDLRGRTAGLWDLEIVNPGTDAAVLPAAFEIRSEPFELHGLTPGDNLASPTVSATITGLGFVDGMQATLDPGDESEDEPIAGTGITVEESSEFQVTFATTGAPIRDWDLVVRHPDGRTLTLEDAFATRGPLAKAAQAASVQATADAPIALARNEARDEYLAVWMEENPFGIIVQWNVWALRLDADGQALGKPLNLTINSPLSQKRTVAAGWDHTRDEYLVAWAERRSVTLSKNGQKHPNGGGTVPIDQVFAQRFKGADLSAAGKPVQVSTHVQFPAASKVAWYLDEFHNFRPSVAYDATADKWVIAWMQEFDTSGVQANDDFNVAQRTLDPATDALGTLIEVGSTTWHEGDPHVFWDPVDQRVVTAWNARAGSDSAPLNLLLGDASGSAVVVEGASGIDLADPKAVVDADSERVLLSWTRVPGKGAQRSVEAILVDQSDLRTTIGTAVSVGQGTNDLVGAVPLWNGSTGDAILSWTEMDFAKGASDVRLRRLRTDATGGLETIGSEMTLSGGKGVEAAPVGVVATGPGIFTVAWLRTLNVIKQGAYPGAAFPGTLRGKEVWLQRIR